ncbi:MAG: rhodanese-like domain-containing protein [Hyphomicrobiales bacterium]|nr:rhodanese-like domain-containing protein [Hyphomicrobiales bacterium]
MELIEREELKSKLDRGDRFKLVMTMGDWAYRLKHIPGSINISSAADADSVLGLDDEIIVYCSGGTCVASAAAYRALKDGGYRSVRHYAGGLEDWEEAGYPLEGDQVERG